MIIEPGVEAPEFNADSSNGNQLLLADYSGKWLILYFYPKDDTPGCTRQACSFRDFYKKLSGLDAVVIGCSPDDLKAHDKFISKYDIPYVLISDADHRVATAYGVWKEKNMYGRKIMGIERSTFLIDPDRRIARVWRRVKVDSHVDEIIDELKMVAR